MIKLWLLFFGAAVGVTEVVSVFLWGEHIFPLTIVASGFIPLSIAWGTHKAMG